MVLGKSAEVDVEPLELGIKLCVVAVGAEVVGAVSEENTNRKTLT